MAMDQQLNVRVTAAELARIDRLAEVLTEKTHGVAVNRSATTRAAIMRGLESFEAEIRGKKRAPKRSAGKVAS